MLHIAEKSECYAVYLKSAQIVHILLVAVGAVPDYAVVGVPEPERRQKSLLASVEYMVVRKGYDVESKLYHLFAEVCRRAEPWVVRRLELICYYGLLIEYGYVSALKVLLNFLIYIVEVVAVLIVGSGSSFCLIVYRGVD